MSGYESKIGSCTLHNQSVLNTFAHLGLYDYTNYLFLDFHKGTPTLYMQYFNGKENLELDFNGYGTVEIIYEVLIRTILSDKIKRRRN